MTTATIRQKLYEYIRFANDEQVKELYDKVPNVSTVTTPWWEDKALLAEVQRRDAAMESGEDKGIPWGEAKKQLLERRQKKGHVI